MRQQLFKGNEYWLWLGTEVDRAKCPCIFMIRTENWRRTRQLGERSFCGCPCRSKDHRQLLYHRQRRGIARTAHTGRWCMVSGRAGSMEAFALNDSGSRTSRGSTGNIFLVRTSNTFSSSRASPHASQVTNSQPEEASLCRFLLVRRYSNRNSLKIFAS